MKRTIKDLPTGRVLVSPSVLASDFSRLGAEIEAADRAGCDMIHLDVMDGHFVPNLSFGPPVIAAVRKSSKLIFDTHLMISNPLKYISAFARAGADHITFHIESDNDPVEVVKAIRSAGCTPGVTLKPGTPVTALKPVIGMVDLVLIMTVEPGFGGQSFMDDMIPKIGEVTALLQAAGNRAHIEVDGGIDAKTAPSVVSAGANVLVAGTAVFKAVAGLENAVAGFHNLAPMLPKR